MTPKSLLIHNSRYPKVTEINPWIYTQTHFLKLCQFICLLYVFQIFSIVLQPETSFNIHLVCFFVWLVGWFCNDSVVAYNDSFTCATLQISTCSLFEYSFFLNLNDYHANSSCLSCFLLNARVDINQCFIITGQLLHSEQNLQIVIGL